MNTVNNSVTLIGNLGEAPQMLDTKTGAKLVKFSLATNEYFSRNGERQSKTQWHRCVLFGKAGESLHKYAQKGSKLAVVGRISYNSYTDKQGVLRAQTQITVHDFTFLGGNKHSNAAG